MAGRVRVRGLPFSRWSLAKLADFLVAERVVEDISHEGLRALLRAEGVSFQAVKTWKASADPDYTAKKARVEQLYVLAEGEAAPGPATLRWHVVASLAAAGLEYGFPARAVPSGVLAGGDGPAGRMMAVFAVGAICRYRGRGFTVGPCSSEKLSCRQSTSTQPTNGALWRRDLGPEIQGHRVCLAPAVAT